jgi:hypothetical protein
MNEFRTLSPPSATVKAVLTRVPRAACDRSDASGGA